MLGKLQKFPTTAALLPTSFNLGNCDKWQRQKIRKASVGVWSAKKKKNCRLQGVMWILRTKLS